MPPKARANVSRGPGRPKKASAPEPAPIAKTQPAQRGRPARTATVELVAEPPKKRGRPAKAKAEEEPVSKTRALRTAKDEAPSVPPKRGRPAKIPALDRVVALPQASPRISKKTSASSAAAPRIDPRIRARLRTRPPAQKAPAQQPPRQLAKRGPGRPRKLSAQTIPAKSVVARAKVAKPTKQVGSRKRRGYTMLEIPDKFLAQMQQTLHDLLHADASDHVSIREDNEITPVSDHGSDVSAQQGALGDDQSQDEEDLEGGVGMDVEVENQEGPIEDEITEEIPELSDEVDVELHVQQIVEVEQVHALNDTSPVPEVNQQLAIRDEDSDDLDGFVPELLAPHTDLYV